MSKVRCLVCNKKMSPDAKSCPKCGAPKRKAVGLSSSNKTFNVIIGFLLFIGGFIAHDIEMGLIEKYPYHESNNSLLDFPLAGVVFTMGIVLLIYTFSSNTKKEKLPMSEVADCFLCSDCDCDVEPNNKFCPNCGANLEERMM